MDYELTKKDNARLLGAAVMALILMYVFFFTPQGQKLGLWTKVFLWVFGCGAAGTIAYAVTPEEKKETLTNSAQTAYLSLN
jgi:hypothetical protein